MIIRNGRIIDPSQKLDQAGDLWIRKGRIERITAPGEIAAPTAPAETLAETILDAAGAWILPGLIDVHVHLREPGQEHKETIETGTRAAAAGGFTTVACMPNTKPVNDSAEITSFIIEKARNAGACRVVPIGAISRGLKGEELSDIEEMIEAGAKALSDDGVTVMNSALMRSAMERAKAAGVPVISHSEDMNLAEGAVMNEGRRSRELRLRGTPAAAEEISVARDIALCRLTGCRVHIAHVSTRLAVEHLRRAKEDGLPVTAEVTPHHLMLTEDSVDGIDSRFKMAPPLRTNEDRKAVQEALATGLIDLIATDHAPHSRSEKSQEFIRCPNGIIGLETAASLTYSLVESGALSLSRWIEALTSGPARLLGLGTGTLKVGQAADVIIFDPTRKWTYTEALIRSKSTNSPFLGQMMKGKVLRTVVEGEQVT